MAPALTAATARCCHLTAGRRRSPRTGHAHAVPEWIETALEPVRGRLGPDTFADLVSALAVVVGWEAFIVLTDVRGLDPEEAGACTRRSAAWLLDAALTESGDAGRPERTTRSCT